MIIFSGKRVWSAVVNYNLDLTSDEEDGRFEIDAVFRLAQSRSDKRPVLAWAMLRVVVTCNAVTSASPKGLSIITGYQCDGDSILADRLNS